MSDTDWLEPLDRRIEEVRRETEAIRKANAALKRLQQKLNPTTEAGVPW